MTKKMCFLFVLATLTAASAVQADFGPLYPYSPMNAVAASPPEPYNLDAIPQCSHVYYQPVPAPVPFSAELPDVPPVYAPFPGPFGMPVPVP